MKTRIVIFSEQQGYHYADVIDHGEWAFARSHMDGVNIFEFDDGCEVAMRIGRDYFIVT